MDNQSLIDHAKQVLELEIAGLQKVRDALGVSFEQAVGTIEASLAAGGRVVVTGIGKNYHIAQKISATLNSTGTPSVLLNVQQAMHGDLGAVSPGDVLIALSYSGESDELTMLIPMIRRRGVPIVAVTGTEESSLAKQSDVVVLATIDQEACPFNMAPTVSTTATLAVGDALAMVLLDRREFSEDDYAKLHPGGAIGRTLSLCVADFMRSGDRLARVRRGQTVRDAVLAMTKARAGAAGIVGDDGSLAGLFTDGDLRRHLFDGADVLDRPIDEIMTADPITVAADATAVDALTILSKHEIDDLPVVDPDGRLVGLIDIQQLPKLKMM